MATLRSLRVMLFVDHSKVSKGMSDAEKEVRNGAKRMNTAIAGAMAGAGLALGTMFWKSIQVAAKRQKLEVSMAVLGGTKKLMDDIRSMARKSSVPMDEWLEGSNRLLGAGIQVKEISSLMESLSNLAAGTGNSIRELGLVYSQVFSKGKLQGEEMLQFMERNVNLMPALMKVLDKSASEIVEMQSKGLVTPADVAKAMKMMTTGKGRFAGMDQALKQTLTGAFIGMQNAFSETLERIGKIILPSLTSLVNEIAILGSQGGLFSTMGEALMVPVAGLAKILVLILNTFNGLDQLTGGLLGKAIGLLSTFVIVVMSLAGAGTLLLASWNKLYSLGTLLLGWLGRVLGILRGIVYAVALVAGAIGSWATAIIAVIIALVAFAGWWLWQNDAADDLIEKLRKQQEILAKNAKLSKQQGGAFGTGAEFGSAQAATIMFGENKQLAIQRQQLEYLRMIAEKEDEIAALEGPSNTRRDGLPRRNSWGIGLDLSGMGN